MMYLGMDVFRFMWGSLSLFCLLINVFHYISEVFSHYIFKYFFSAILSSSETLIRILAPLFCPPPCLFLSVYFLLLGFAKL